MFTKRFLKAKKKQKKKQIKSEKKTIGSGYLVYDVLKMQFSPVDHLQSIKKAPAIHRRKKNATEIFCRFQKRCPNHIAKKNADPATPQKKTLTQLQCKKKSVGTPNHKKKRLAPTYFWLAVKL